MRQVNRCTAPLPTQAAVADWGFSATGVLSTGWSVGLSAAQITRVATVGTQDVWAGPAPFQGPAASAVRVLAGEQLNVRCEINHSAASKQGRVEIDWYNDAGTLISTSVGGSVALTANTWTVVTTGQTAPANTVTARVRLVMLAAAENTITGFRRVVIARGWTASSYVDGDTTTLNPDGTYATRWRWAGTPHLSESLGPITGIELVVDHETPHSTALGDGRATSALLEIDAPAPEEDPTWATSVDRDGELLARNRHRSRTVTVKWRITAETYPLLEALTAQADAALHRARSEGGTLTFFSPNGVDRRTLDIQSVTYDATLDSRAIRRFSTDVTAKFTCDPYWRGDKQVLSTWASSAQQVVADDIVVPGTVPALGELTVDGVSVNHDIGRILWAIQSRYRDSASTAPLILPATSIPAANLDAEATVDVVGGTVQQTPDTHGWKAFVILRQAGAAPFTHRGRYRVLARINVYDGTNPVDLALEWSAGTGQPTRNDPFRTQQVLAPNVAYQRYLADLGTIDAGNSGSWTGRLLVRGAEPFNTSLQYINLLSVLFVPLDEGHGDASHTLPSPTLDAAGPQITRQPWMAPTSGNLAGTAVTMPASSQWQGAGDTDDFVFDNPGVRRATTLDTDPRYNTITNTAALSQSSCVQVDFLIPTPANIANVGVEAGVIARWTSPTQHVRAAIIFGEYGTLARFYAPGAIPSEYYSRDLPEFEPDTWWTIRLFTDTSGRVAVWAAPKDRPTLGSPLLDFQHAALRTGGSLASGLVGIVDSQGGTEAIVRKYRAFRAWQAQAIPVLTEDGVHTVDARSARLVTPAAASDIPDYVGDYLLLPPSINGRRCRVLAATSTTRGGLPEQTLSPAPSLTYTLSATPRGIHLPTTA